jgi:uncharacterized protein YndB with AHSA1/START domain
MEKDKFEFTQTVQASPGQVFFAFTNATALKEWMCDVATTSPKVGGRIYMSWNSGFYASGEFTVFDPGQRLAFTWYGRNEPAPTLVEVSLHSSEDKTEVRVVHSGLGSGETWQNMIREVEEGWPTSLENLASVLESGPDLRVMLRPMLGITVGDFDAGQAEHLGVPVSEGIRLDSALEAMGAYAAGLRKDDVIISLAGHDIKDWATLASALSGYRAGDIVEVIFYRGAEKLSTQMELSQRPVPEIPSTVVALAQVIKERYEHIRTQLDDLMNDILESEASINPAPGEWSIKEVLAHLIHGERDGQAYLTELVAGQVSWSDDYAGNLAMRMNATLAVYPTLAELRQELSRLYHESVALYENIPADFPQQRKGTWWGMCYYAFEPPYHEYGHFEQIQAALDFARKS